MHVILRCTLWLLHVAAGTVDVRLQDNNEQSARSGCQRFYLGEIQFMVCFVILNSLMIDKIILRMTI